MSKVSSGETKNTLYCVLRQEPARGAQAHRRPDRIYLRRRRSPLAHRALAHSRVAPHNWGADAGAGMAAEYALEKLMHAVDALASGSQLALHVLAWALDLEIESENHPSCI